MPQKNFRLWIWVGLIILATAISYSNSLKNGFVAWDDDTHVYANQDIRNLDGQAIRAFFAGYYLKMYAPVTMASYALDYKIGGLNPAVYHRANLIIHLFNVALVFYFLYRLTGQKAVAVISALFFGIHPLHAESVAWISERKDLLYVFFYLCGLIAWIGRRDGKMPRTCYALALFLFLLSLLSKSAAVTFPLVLLLVDFYRGPRSREAAGKITLKNHLDKIPFFLPAAAFGALSLFSQKVIGADLDYVVGYTIPDRLFMGAYAFAFYLIESVFPWKLSALHPMPMKPDGFLPVSYYLSIVIVIGFAVLLVKVIRAYLDTRRVSMPDSAGGINVIPPRGIKRKTAREDSGRKTGKRNPQSAELRAGSAGAELRQKDCVTASFSIARGDTYKDILFGLLFFLFTISLVLFIPVGSAIVAERYTYLSYIGIFMIEGRLYMYFCGAGSASRRHVLTAVIAAAAVLFSGMTYARNRAWKDSMTLFSDVIEKNPDASAAYNNRGNLRMEQEDFEGAAEDFNKAIELKNFNAYNNRGVLKNRMADYQGALDDLNLAERSSGGNNANVLYNRGIAKLSLGDFRGAEEDFSGAIKINPRYADAYGKRGFVRYDKLSDIEGAIPDFDEAVRLAPDDVYALYNRGNALLLSGRIAEALADYDRTVERAPQFSAAHFNRGVALLRSGRQDAACQSWKNASELGEKASVELTAKYCQ